MNKQLIRGWLAVIVCTVPLAFFVGMVRVAEMGAKAVVALGDWIAYGESKGRAFEEFHLR